MYLKTACQEFCVTVNLRLKNILQTEGKLPPLSSLSQMVKTARGQNHPRGLDLRDAYASENSLKHLLQRVDVLIESPLYIPDVPPFFKNPRTWHQ